MLQHSLYHSLLRISALTLASTLVFVSGIASPITKELTHTTEQYLANAVSATAGVAPTEFNTITAGLTEQRIALEAREAALMERELAVGLQAGERVVQFDIETLTNTVLLGVIILLLLLNYILDFRARHRMGVYNTSVTAT